MKKAESESPVPALIRAAKAPQPDDPPLSDPQDESQDPEPINPLSSAPPAQKPLDEMTDTEVRDYYETFLIGRPHAQMSPYDLSVLARNGEIAAARRTSEERMGEQAKLTLVRQKIQEQAERQGMAAYLLDRLNASIPLLRRDDPTDEVRITVSYAGRSIEIGMTDVQEAWKLKTSGKTTLFQQIVTNLLQLVRDAATQKRANLNRSDGRDWTTLTEDIKWRAVVDELNQAHH